MRREYWGSFHSLEEMVAALPAAVAAENKKHPEAEPTTIEEARENLLDYVPAESYAVERRFPSLPMAKAWAESMFDRDAFGCTEARVVEVNEGDPWEERETVEQWHFDGETWHEVGE